MTLEHDAVLVFEDGHPERHGGVAHESIATARIRPVVAIPVDALDLGIAQQRRDHALGLAALDDEPLTARRQRRLEACERVEQEAQPRRAERSAAQQALVEHEEQHEFPRRRGRCGERRVVAQSEVAAEPVDDAIAASHGGGHGPVRERLLATLSR